MRHIILTFVVFTFIHPPLGAEMPWEREQSRFGTEEDPDSSRKKRIKREPAEWEELDDENDEKSLDDLEEDEFLDTKTRKSRSNKFLDVENTDRSRKYRYESEDGEDEYDEESSDWEERIRKRKLKKKKKKRRRRGRRGKRRKRKLAKFEIPVSLSAMLHTPLLQNNIQNSRFESFGTQVLLTVPIDGFAKYALIHGEVGLAFTGNRFSILQGEASFTQVHVLMPIRGRLLFPMGNVKLVGEVFLGLQPVVFIYDSREGEEGGIRFTDDFFGNIQLDAGLGISYYVGKSTALRLSLGYRFLAAGITFKL